MSFNLDTFIAECIAVSTETDASKQIADLISQAVADPEALYAEIGRPESAKIERLYVSDTLTVLNVVWAPKMTLLPHNHNMWAVIGVYSGREDNILWRRLSGDAQNQIEAAGAKTLGVGDVQQLGKNIIHSVTNPTTEFTGAIHIYGGNFFENERSEWDPQTLKEQPYDVPRNLKSFEVENSVAKLREELKSNS
ncbi:MAG: hypothetical protein ACPGF7_04915 [Pontibacterium sp.]